MIALLSVLAAALGVALVVLAATYHRSQLRGYAAARKRATVAELFIDRLQQQAEAHTQVDHFAHTVLHEIDTHKKANSV